MSGGPFMTDAQGDRIKQLDSELGAQGFERVSSKIAVNTEAPYGIVHVLYSKTAGDDQGVRVFWIQPNGEQVIWRETFAPATARHLRAVR